MFRAATVISCLGVSLAMASDGGPLTDREILNLAERCAPSVHPETILAVVRTESSGRAWAININGSANPPIPETEADAVYAVEAMIEAGFSVDVGLGQINSANFNWLGLSPETALDPCNNIRAAGEVLAEAFGRLRPRFDSDQAALDAALSTYNTGHSRRGIDNGYVSRVRSYAVPAPNEVRGAQEIDEVDREPWMVFGRRNDRSVFD